MVAQAAAPYDEVERFLPPTPLAVDGCPEADSTFHPSPEARNLGAYRLPPSEAAAATEPEGTATHREGKEQGTRNAQASTAILCWETGIPTHRVEFHRQAS